MTIFLKIPLYPPSPIKSLEDKFPKGDVIPLFGKKGGRGYFVKACHLTNELTNQSIIVTTSAKINRSSPNAFIGDMVLIKPDSR